MRLVLLLSSIAACSLMLIAAPASAEVFRCKMPDGRMAYQDVACPENGDQKVVAPSRIKPPPPRQMTEQDYHDQRMAQKSQQDRYRQQMQAEQLARNKRYTKPYVAGIGGGNGRQSRCMDDIERRKAEVRNGAYKQALDDADIARRREALERCND
ncbi:MAG: DUF4124 domain-containing protein [Pseudomonadota bacterium]